MATVTAYNSGLLTLTNGGTAFATDACYAILVNAYTFSDAHTAYSNVSSTELSTAGDYDRVALGSKTVAIVTGSPDKILYDCANISFGDPVSIGPADGIIILKGTAATPNSADPLLFYAPISPAATSTTAAFSINTTNGLYEISIA
jgi:hypothetical protein